MSRLKKLFTPQTAKNTSVVSWRSQKQDSADDHLVMNVISEADGTVSESQHADVSDAVVAEQPATQSCATAPRANTDQPAASSDTVAQRSVTGHHCAVTAASESPPRAKTDQAAAAGPASQDECDAVVAVDVTTVGEQEQAAAMNPAQWTPCSSAISAQSQTVRCSVLMCLFIHINMFC